MLKKKLQDKELVIGTWMSLPSCAVAEIMALSGFDLVVTSPPYGDSPTTMAYEQFSWLPNVWLKLDRRPPGKLAKEMLGGIVAKKIDKIGYSPIDRAIEKMSARRKKGRSEKYRLRGMTTFPARNFSRRWKRLHGVFGVFGPSVRVTGRRFWKKT